MYNHAVTMPLEILTDFDADTLADEVRAGNPKAVAQVWTAIYRRLIMFQAEPGEMTEALFSDVYDTYEVDDEEGAELYLDLGYLMDPHKPGGRWKERR